MKIPDLADMIDEWENAHAFDVKEMIMISKDELFIREADRMKQMIAAVNQIPIQLLVEGTVKSWIP